MNWIKEVEEIAKVCRETASKGHTGVNKLFEVHNPKREVKDAKRLRKKNSCRP